MKKFIIMTILSLLITQIFHIFFSEEKAGLQTRNEKKFKVILDQGVIGCTSQEKFDLVQKLYIEKKIDEIKKNLVSKNCFVFKKDEEFEGLENYCNEDSKINDNFIFSSKKFLLTKIILPCYAFKTISN